MILHYQHGDEYSREKIIGHLDRLKLGSEYLIEIKLNRPVRSIKMNKYYWLILKAIAIHTGETKERLHELFKSMFNYSERQFKNGLTARQPESTTTLDSQQFTLYIEKVKKFAEQEWGCIFLDHERIDHYTLQSINEEYSNVFDRV